MIVESNREFEGGNDVFSLGGRLALVGGGAYAISKTFDESKTYKNSVFHPQRDKMRTDLADLVRRTSEARTPTQEQVFFRSNFFNSIYSDKTASMRFATSKNLSDMEKYFKGGYKGRSSNLYSEMQSLVTKVEGLTGAADVRYKLHNGEVSYVNIKGGKNINLTINPILSNGNVLMGMDGQNQYATKSLYRKAHGAMEYYGADIGLARSYNENLERLIRGELSSSDIYSQYDATRTFSDKQYGNMRAELGHRANPDVVKFVKESAIEDPGLKIRPGGSEMMSPGAKKDFMIKEAIAGRAASSASDFSKGVLLFEDSPVFSFPFLEETANPKQIFRNVQHVGKDGVSSYIANKKTLFLDEAEMNSFRDILSSKGVSIGELAEEQLIANSQTGRIIDRARGLSISASGMSEHSEFLLKRLSEATGRNAKDFSEMLASKGFSAFSEEEQRAMRNISLDDYSGFLNDEARLTKSAIEKTELDIQRAINAGADSDILANLNERKALHENTLSNIKEKIKNQNYFGKKTDLIEDQFLKNSHKGLLLDDVHYSEGTVSFALRREKALGAGDKIHNTSGEVKSIIKASVNDIEDALVGAFKKHNVGASSSAVELFRQKIKGIDFVANKSTLKTDLVSRNASDVFYSVFQRAHRENNTRLIHELETFKQSYPNIAPEERSNIFRKIKSITGQSAASYATQNVGFGVMKEHMVAFGNAAVDMGSGNIGSLSERHLFNFKAMGANAFAEDVMSRKINKDSFNALTQMQEATKNAKDLSYKNVLPINDVSLNELFPYSKTSDVEDVSSILKERRTYLQSKGISGTGMIDLGEEIHGVRRIPIFSDDIYRGFVGGQIGAKSDQRKYSILDKRVKELVREVQRPGTRNQEKLKTLVKNYQTAMDQMESTLKKGLFKDKVQKSFYGMVDSAPEGLERYAKALNKYYGTKSGMANVAVVGDEQFAELFGKRSLKDIQKATRKFGMIGKNTNFSDLNKLIMSDAWAMITRDPAEGISHMAMNIMPASAFKGAGGIPGGVSVVTSPDAKGYQILNSLFGDADGDSFQVVAATNAKSKQELYELAYGNSKEAVNFREAQRSKAEISLKGRAQKGLLDLPIEERREIIARAKQLEKGEIGAISNILKPIHEMNRSAAMSSGASKKFFNLANTLHFFAENSIKGKHQSTQELREGKVFKILESLTNENESLSTRKSRMLSFFDELVLGEDSTELANRLRKGENTYELAEALRKHGISEPERIMKSGWFRNVASQENIDTMFDFYSTSQKIGTTADDALEIAIDEITNTVSKKQKIPFNKITDLVEANKASAFRGMKNLGKYAILPAAGIGLAGTLLGGTNSLKADGEKQYSDAQGKHAYSGGHEQRPLLRPLKAPKYERIQMRGRGTDQMNLAPLGAFDRSNVHIQDDSKLLDKYEIQEIVERGI